MTQIENAEKAFWNCSQYEVNKNLTSELQISFQVSCWYYTAKPTAGHQQQIQQPQLWVFTEK